jgi:uncharacterized DUF497 family protein
MSVPQIIWDLDDDPDGNVQHIAEHGLTQDEVEEVLLSPESTSTSRATGQPMVFGSTSTGRYVVVVHEEIAVDTLRPVTAYDVQPPRPGRSRKRKR